MMEFQIEGLTENWLIFKKEGRGVEFQGTNVVCILGPQGLLGGL